MLLREKTLEQFLALKRKVKSAPSSPSPHLWPYHTYPRLNICIARAGVSTLLILLNSLLQTWANFGTIGSENGLNAAISGSQTHSQLGRLGTSSKGAKLGFQEDPNGLLGVLVFEALQLGVNHSRALVPHALWLAVDDSHVLWLAADNSHMLCSLPFFPPSTYPPASPGPLDDHLLNAVRCL